MFSRTHIRFHDEVMPRKKIKASEEMFNTCSPHVTIDGVLIESDSSLIR